MAQIDTSKLSSALQKPGAFTVKVGNNRTVSRDGAGHMIGALHGHAIVVFKPCERTLTLDPHGYHTVTTRQAMKDLGETITGVPVNVSFAKGGFWAKVAGDEYTATDGAEKIVARVDLE